MPNYRCWETGHEDEGWQEITAINAEFAAHDYAEQVYANSAGEIGMSFEVCVQSPLDNHVYIYPITVEFTESFHVGGPK